MRPPAGVLLHRRSLSNFQTDPGAAMNVLAQQLNNPEAAGSYSLQCGVDELRAAANDANFALFDAGLKGVKGKQNFLVVLAQAANFPPRVGGNWDALADEPWGLSSGDAGG